MQGCGSENFDDIFPEGILNSDNLQPTLDGAGNILGNFETGRGHRRPRPIIPDVPKTIEDINKHGCPWGRDWALHLESITTSQESSVLASVQLAKEIKSNYGDLSVRLSRLFLQIQNYTVESRRSNDSDKSTIADLKEMMKKQDEASTKFKKDMFDSIDSFKSSMNSRWWTWALGSVGVNIISILTFLAILKYLQVI